MKFFVNALVSFIFAIAIVHFSYSTMTDFQQAVLFWGIYIGLLTAYTVDTVRTAIIEGR